MLNTLEWPAHRDDGRRKLHKTAEIYNAPVTVGHTFRPWGVLQSVSLNNSFQKIACRRKLPLTLNHSGRPIGVDFVEGMFGWDISRVELTMICHMHRVACRPRGTSLPPVLQQAARS